MKDTSSWQPDAELTLTGVSHCCNESSLFLSTVTFNKFLFPFRTRIYEVTLVGLVFSSSEKNFTLIVIAFMFIEIIFRCKASGWVLNSRPSGCI